jgi:hypothetical protein
MGHARKIWLRQVLEDTKKRGKSCHETEKKGLGKDRRMGDFLPLGLYKMETMAGEEE